MIKGSRPHILITLNCKNAKLNIIFHFKLIISIFNSEKLIYSLF